MPIPSFKDTLQANLGPGITIVSGGNYFDIEEKANGVDIETMNKELAGGDEVVFMQSNPPKEDLSFKFFLNSQKEEK